MKFERARLLLIVHRALRISLSFPPKSLLIFLQKGNTLTFDVPDSWRAVPLSPVRRLLPRIGTHEVEPVKFQIPFHRTEFIF
jgi:hypothetical protein